MAKEYTADERLNAGVAPEIVAAMYSLDVKELKAKQREMQESQEDWGGRIAKTNAQEQPANEITPEVETDELGVIPKPVTEEPVEETVEEVKEEPAAEEEPAPAPKPKKAKKKRKAKKKK